MLKLSLKSAFTILSALILLSSCAKIKISDSEWCGDAGPLGAFCFNTLSDKSRDIAKEDWDKERFGMICTKSENFAEWKASLLKLCKDSKICSMEVIKTVEALDERVESTKKKINHHKK